MAVAHIVVEIEELPNAEETLNIRLTYSGGNDLETQEGHHAFVATVDAIGKVLAGE